MWQDAQASDAPSLASSLAPSLTTSPACGVGSGSYNRAVADDA